jgi:flagellar basal-body rod protein FlgF
MDRLIYTAMSGANQVLGQQATVSQNLANTHTPGFRAAINTFRSVPLVGEGLPTRVFVADSSAGVDFTAGSMEPTGRNLDVAIDGKGWLAVQAPDGKESYTRNGGFKITSNGILQTQSGLNVIGDAGPITVPPNTEVTIAKDGTISTVPSGSKPAAVVTVGRLKLTNPPESQMVRTEDGMFRTLDGKAAPADSKVTVVSGNLESSNVSAVEAMVNMISLARQFDNQMKMLQTADNDAKAATSLLSING